MTECGYKNHMIVVVIKHLDKILHIATDHAVSTDKNVARLTDSWRVSFVSKEICKEKRLN